eukprot:Skav236385  [mRNA]  locus=scaffold29:66683:68254:+ [translate_table: standard]
MTPTALQDCRVACIPKEAKIQQHLLEPKSLRPISLLSGWWRVWSATWLRHEPIQKWAKSFIPVTQAGGLPGSCGPEVMAAVSDVELQKHGYGISLDFRHAFDAIPAQLLGKALLSVVPPSVRPWLSTVTAQMSQLKRWYTYGGHVHEHFLCPGVGLPQGDASSPLLMSLLLRVGMEIISKQFGDRIFQCTFMDDRTLIGSDPNDLLAAKDLWGLFAQAFKMAENDSKAQFACVGQPSVGVFTQPFLEVLGTLVGQPSPSDIERNPRTRARLQQTLKMARRIGFLPQAMLARHTDLHIFCRTAFVCGWVAANPTPKLTSQYNAGVWRVVGKLKYSIRGLRSVIGGAISELDPAVLWRQLRVLAKRNVLLQQLQRPVGHDQLHLLLVDDKVWKTLSHSLRETWRRMQMQMLDFSSRHELEDYRFEDVQAFERIALGGSGSSQVLTLGLLQWAHFRVQMFELVVIHSIALSVNAVWSIQSGIIFGSAILSRYPKIC